MTVIRNHLVRNNNAIVAGAAVATSSAILLYNQSSPSQAEQKKQAKANKKLEVYLMDRIAKKPYLNYHSVPNTIQAKRTYRGRRSDENTTVNSTNAPQNTRPKGVPSRIRLLVLDVPKFKEEALEDDAVCQLPSEIFSTNGPKFVDGVAPPKAVDKKSTTGYYYSKDDKSSRKERRANMKPIAQKSLAKQLYYCYDSKQISSDNEIQKQQPVIGVEILEGSIMDLNPHNIRRTYTSTSGKMRKSHTVYPSKLTEGVADVDEANEVETETEVEEEVETDEEEDLNESEETEKLDTLANERTAPWNQYAWLEEMYLRINGIVPFSEPVHRAHTISRWLYGRIYSHTIAPTYSAHRLWMWWWWPAVFSYNRSNLIKNGGVDGNGECNLYGDESNRRGLLTWPPSLTLRKKLNRASNKPHAVIADGAALHRVPGSLRFLTKTCRDANVPLFILNDPRSWGSQTHSTLSEAVVDIRRSVTDNVVSHCLDIREGSAFERGRLVGQFEKELAWQASEAARKTRETWKSARRRLERDKCEDWSELDDEELRQKLIERKVLTLGNDDGEQSNSHVQSITSTKQLLEICRKCLEEEEKGTGR